MPTFRQDVKLGTRVPLIGTSDISDRAVTKDKLDTGLVKDIIEEAKLLNERKKKKKQQIIIGKAIRVKSCDIGAVENWYVQLYQANLYYRNGNIDSAEKIHLKVYEKSYGQGEEEYEEIEFSINVWLTCIDTENRTGTVVWYLSDIDKMFRVDRYEETMQDDGTITLSVWLSYKPLPLSPTIKDISSRYEIINGKRVLRSKKDILKFIDLNSIQGFNINFSRFDLFRRKNSIRNKRYRDNFKGYENDMKYSPKTLFKKRWRKIIQYSTYDKINYVGHYKLVVRDKYSSCKQVGYFYVKREDVDHFVIQKTAF